ncbi:MAG TPA: SGNH/GDSL hydrolase family protein [Syntrophomonas sp.]|nr:SGNH/GDSL hydrolase family protein [Syntrophomonas sp.]
MNKTSKIVCLGDSITYGWPWGPEVSWTTMLAGAIDAEVINRGIPGNTTSQMLARLKQAVLKHNPTHVIIMGGLNDIICQESFDRIVWNLRAMAEQASEHGIKVIFGMPTAVDDEYIEKLAQRVRNWITEYAEDHNISIIPFNQAFYDQNGHINTRLLSADGAHPTREGYRAMFACIDLPVFDN